MDSTLQTPLPPVFVALDMPEQDVDAFVEQFSDLNLGLKVGMELFYQSGPSLVRRLAKKHPIFLDLKLHDIPNTVREAAKQIADLGVRVTTVHAAGGPAMLEPLKAVEDQHSSFQFLAVTVLTSMDNQQMQALGVQDANPAERTTRLFNVARNVGLSGFICSPLEVGALHAAMPKGTFITPGVRPAGAALDDQSRVATPSQAIKAGATSLVIGRPISKAPNPREAAEAILQEIARG